MQDTFSGDAEQQASEKLKSLNLQFIHPLPMDLSKVFPKLSGMGWKGDMKMRCKYLNACGELLLKTLKEGEEIIYVAKGVQQKFSEQYFLGIWAHYINQTVFVFTNLRVILLNSNTKGKPKHTFWSIFYCEVSKFKGSMFGSASLVLNDGSKFKYSGFKGIDRKQISEVVEQARIDYETMGFQPTSTQSRENLCSTCVEIVPKDQYQCDNCGQQFYEPMALAKRSLIFPSWGDFCMGHTVLAFMELLGYIVSWIVFVSVLKTTGDEGNLGFGIGIVLFLLTIEHGIDAILTYYIAKKGLTPKNRSHS